MEKMKLNKFSAFFVFLFVFSVCGVPVYSSVDDRALVQGFEAYRNGDWESATLFLRKAVTVPQNSTPEAWYMLVLSQMYSGDFSSAVNDCIAFEDKFPESALYPYVEYQKGRALHFLKQNDSAVLVLSDFCHQYPVDELYPSALFWIAECFYDDFNYDTARALYERIVAEFGDSAKAKDAASRLEDIGQHDREEKLLYLLKMTGEEYLSSRENYEKQLKEYQTESVVSLRRQLSDAQARIAELERAAEDNASRPAPAVQEETVAEQSPAKSSRAEEILALKSKASRIQTMLDEKTNKQE